jgi:hypothetical protein
MWLKSSFLSDTVSADLIHLWLVYSKHCGGLTSKAWLIINTQHTSMQSN